MGREGEREEEESFLPLLLRSTQRSAVESTIGLAGVSLNACTSVCVRLLCARVFVRVCMCVGVRATHGQNPSHDRELNEENH